MRPTIEAYFRIPTLLATPKVHYISCLLQSIFPILQYLCQQYNLIDHHELWYHKTISLRYRDQHDEILKQITCRHDIKVFDRDTLRNENKY